MAYTAPSVADFKSRFDRDFAFSADQSDLTKVRDKDVTLAQTQAASNFNEGLWESQALYSEALLLLSAHYLCSNILASSQGLGGAASWLTQSKSVGNLTEAYQIPDRVLRSPTLSIYSRTPYGMNYLSLIAVRLVGNVVGIFRSSSSA